MSIKEMIKEHPSVGSDYNESLGEAVKHAMYCAAICNSCADACSAEEMDMRRCIRLCMDCADVCTAAYRVASRRTDHNRQLIRTMLATCIEAALGELNALAKAYGVSLADPTDQAPDAAAEE